VIPGRGPASSAFGIGVSNLSGDLPNDETYGELQVSLAYARGVGLGLQSGLRLRLLQTRSIDDGPEGGGFAFDLGLEGNVAGWRVGGVFRALLSEVRWDRSVDAPLPTGYDLGAERSIRPGLTAAAGATLRDDWQPRRLAVALLWDVPGTPIQLRLAPALRDTEAEKRFELSGGSGIKVHPITVEYGMRTGPPGLGEIHRFGLRAALP
jgi:hypothetical protein